MHYLYVLRSLTDGRLYTGITSDLARRLADHNGGRSRATRYRRPFVLVYTEAYNTRAEAMARERYFKTAEGGVLKRRLIDKSPPEPAGGAT